MPIRVHGDAPRTRAPNAPPYDERTSTYGSVWSPNPRLCELTVVGTDDSGHRFVLATTSTSHRGDVEHARHRQSRARSSLVCSCKNLGTRGGAEWPVHAKGRSGFTSTR